MSNSYLVPHLLFTSHTHGHTNSLASHTELRKTANLESAGNNVIVFNGDEVIILEEGSEFHLIKTGKKKGYINA